MEHIENWRRLGEVSAMLPMFQTETKPPEDMTEPTYLCYLRIALSKEQDRMRREAAAIERTATI